MSRRAGVMAALVALLVVGMLPGLAEARTNNRTKPVLFIHGLDAFGDPGADCASYWNDMERKFRDWGHTGPLIELSFYRYDTNCDHTINHHGSHSRHYASGHYSTGGHGANTDIRHLAYHLGWYIYSHFTSEGRTVDVVAHSMGGLIIRYALAQVQRGHVAFPPRLLVEDAVTMGTPHRGARALVYLCPYTQCDQMEPGSGFIGWLADHAPEPDGAGGTDWSAFGSHADNLVDEDSAVGMAACHKVKWLSSSGIEHGDFMHVRSGANSTETSADVQRRSCPGDWVTDYTSHWPVRRAELAVTFGDR